MIDMGENADVPNVVCIGLQRNELRRRDGGHAEDGGGGGGVGGVGSISAVVGVGMEGWCCI